MGSNETINNIFGLLINGASQIYHFLKLSMQDISNIGNIFNEGSSRGGNSNNMKGGGGLIVSNPDDPEQKISFNSLMQNGSSVEIMFNTKNIQVGSNIYSINDLINFVTMGFNESFISNLSEVEIGSYFEFTKLIEQFNLDGDLGNFMQGIKPILEHNVVKKIKGIDKTSKHIDIFLLNIDTIFHMRKIITQSGDTISPSSVTTKIFKQRDNKPIIVITIKPDINIKYQLIDGCIYYRINASNYKISTSRMYTEAEVDSKVIRIRGAMMKETNRIMDLLQKRNRQLEEQVSKMSRDTTRNDLEKMLFTKILNDKEEVDMKIKQTIKVSFCCGIVDFLFN
jgi:hypothetical protein